jgi:hypothetical protein
VLLTACTSLSLRHKYNSNLIYENLGLKVLNESGTGFYFTVYHLLLRYTDVFKIRTEIMIPEYILFREIYLC